MSIEITRLGKTIYDYETFYNNLAPLLCYWYQYCIVLIAYFRDLEVG